MDVGLHKARKDGATLRLDNYVSGLACLANARDAAVADEQVSAHDGIVCVHRQKGSTFNENRFLHWVSGIGRQVSDVRCRVLSAGLTNRPAPDIRHLIPGIFRAGLSV